VAISASNIQGNHRGIYLEWIGDGATTSIVVPLSHIHTRPSMAGVATVLTAPTGTFERHSGKGGFIFPQGGTPVTVSSATVSNGTPTVQTSAAVGNGTKAYCCYVFNESSARG